jgi:toxin CcdB
MAQYDVHANPNAAQRAAFPFLVVIQSAQLDHHSTRLVMPLARLPRRPSREPRRLSMAVQVAGETLYPMPHLCAPFPAKMLRAPEASLLAESAVLLDALDAVVSGV